jgi:hypothetical protein
MDGSKLLIGAEAAQLAGAVYPDEVKVRIEAERSREFILSSR